MTDQYRQTNVNQPRGARDVNAYGELNLDDEAVVVDSSLGPVTLSLPEARIIPRLGGLHQVPECRHESGDYCRHQWSNY